MLRSRPLPLAAAAAALLLFGCAGPRPAAAPVPAPPRAERPPPFTAASPADSVVAWARARCGALAGREKDACLERSVVSLLEPAGLAKTMAVLDRLVALDADARREAHALAHGVGIAAYRGRESMGRTFAACPVTQISGCHHGVMQAWFDDVRRTEGGIGAEVLNAVCEEHRPRRFIFFQCAHGLGHGLLALHGNHLPRALESCDLLREDWVRQSCYGGVFMENVVHVTHPHNTTAGHTRLASPASEPAGGGHAHGHAGAAAPARADSSAGARHARGDGGKDHPAGADSAGEHGHDHAGGGAPAPWKPIDPADPLYPCSAVAEKYLSECYINQTAVILHLNGGDVAAAGRTCAGAPERMVRVCFFSLGRDISGLAGQDPDRAEALCLRVDAGPGRTWCLLSVAQNLVNHAADARAGLRFCRRVPGAGSKEQCNQVVGGMLADIEPSAARRAEVCAEAEPGQVPACREWAGLPPEPARSAEAPPR